MSIRAINAGTDRFLVGDRRVEPGETVLVDHITPTMRKFGFRPATSADREDVSALDAEQARERADSLLARNTALEAEIAAYRVRLEEHPKEIARLESVISVARSERDAAVADAERAARAAQLLEDQMSTGSSVDRPWIDSESLTSWVNEQRKIADADADPFSGKYAKTRALAWCATQGDVACANMWAESHKG